MNLGFTFLIVLALILVIWVFIEIQRFRHKLFAISLIVAILFFYASFSLTLRGEDINYASVEGISHAANLYFVWLGNTFTNFKSLTANAIKMNWGINETIR